MYNKDNIDFVYLNRPHISIKYINFIKKNTDIKIIYYGHDLHFLRLQREAVLKNDSQLLKMSESSKRDELEIMRKSDMVYYPSYIEKNAISEIDPSIKVKTINAYIFDTAHLDMQYSAENRNGILFVGGFRHTPNVDAVKWFAKFIFPKIQAKNNSIQFYIAGSNAQYNIKKLDGNGVVFKGFVSESELKQLYSSCRIVVAPLRYGAGVKGKVIEALYNGMPVVTTSIGAEGIEGIENIAKIHDDEEDFANAILDLYEDKDQLERMSRSSLNFIKEKFSMDAAWNIIKEDFA